MNEEWIDVVQDARLTPDAVRLILEVASRGEGEHEISHTRFSVLLNHQGGDRRVSRALSVATELGWLERIPGGRGHSDRYSFSPYEFRGAKDSPHESGGSKKDSYHESGIPKTDSPPELRIANPTVVVRSRKNVDVDAENARAREGPNLHPLEERVDDLLDNRSDDLAGCRGAFRDYLQTRVPTDRQYGYVQTLATWLDGADPSVFRTPDGSRAPPGDVPGILATAFNELLASDESLMKRPVGDPANLRTKINVLLKQRAPRNDHQSRSRTKEPRNAKPGTATVSDIRGRRGTASG